MRKILTTLIMLVLMASMVQAAMTYGGANYITNKRHALSGKLGNDPLYNFIDEVECIINDSTLDNGNLLSFDNSGSISNETSGRIIFGDGTEDIQFVFSANSIMLNSSTGVAVFDFNSIVPKTSYLTVGSTTYTLPASDGTGGQVLQTNGSRVLSFVAAGAGTSETLDMAYDQGGAGAGRAITVDAGAIVLTAPDANDNVVLSLVQSDTGTSKGMTITNAGTGVTVDIQGQAGGKDIEGTGDTWNVSGAGVATFVSVAAPSFTGSSTGSVTAGSGGLVLSNGATITNTTNTEITFTEDNGADAENLSFDFLPNRVDLKSTTGVGTFGFGDIDDLTGINNITFDASYSTITLTANDASDDLVIELQGNQASSLYIGSSGTGSDSIILSSTNGGIDILCNGADAGEDIDIYTTASVNITSDEAAADAIVIAATKALGGIDITSNADIDITTTGAAGEDITILNTGGSIDVNATEAAADAILIRASNAAGGIMIDYGTGNLDITGTGASADFLLDADLFSIDGTGVSNVTVTSNAGSEDFTVALAGATDSSLILSSTGTGDDALQITTTAGGIDILNGGAAGGTEDLDITSTNATVIITGGEADAAAVRLRASNAAGGMDVDYGTGDFTITGNGAGADFILDTDLFSIDGTGTSNVTVTSTADAEDFTVALAGAFNSSLILSSTGTAADALQLTASAGGVLVSPSGAMADQFKVNAVGTVVGNAINLVTTDGGIIATAGGAANGDITLSAGDDIILTNVGQITLNGVATQLIEIEGTGGDGFQTTLSFTDPTADVTYTFPTGTITPVAVMTSTLVTNAPDIANSVTGGTNQLIFEGTANDFETILTAVDATTPDKTITLPNASGVVILSAGVEGAANAITGGTGTLIWEGSSEDEFETTLSVTNPTADRAIIIPDKAGQVMLSSAASVLTPGVGVTLTVGLSNIYTDTPTDDQNQTITFSGAGTAGDVITIIFTTVGNQDEVITFEPTLVSSAGTLTCGTTAARYMVITFVSNGTHWFEVSRTAEQT